MDLRYSEEDDKFRADIRQWIKENKPQSADETDNADRVVPADRWAKKLREKGYGAPAWPVDAGGAGLTVMQQVIWNEECATAGVANGLVGMGTTMVGPTLIAHGSEEQKKRFLPGILSGNDIWCQGFSEPGAGSDLAGLQSKAVEDGDDYLITGQKTWTSGAQYANKCFFLARTDPEAPKHKGISYFLVEDMKTPGIEVRPIRELTGHEYFCEMFWDKVRVPKKNIVGGVNNGWKVAMSTLAHERTGLSSVVGYKRTLARLKRLAQKTKRNGVQLSKDKNIRKKLVQFYFDVHAHTYTGYRNLAAALKGLVPGPEAYVGKILTAELTQRTNEFGVELQGPYGQLAAGSPEAVEYGSWQTDMLFSRAVTIYGGSSEINRNLVAERALGLPSWKTAARLAKEGKAVG